MEDIKMSEDGKNILKLVKQIKNLCEQTSLLLRTADERMEKEGWESYKNTAIAWSSGSVQNPKQWFPDTLFRFYTNNSYENILLVVSIFLDDDFFGEYKEEITEPLITAGCFDFGRDNKVSDAGDYWIYHYAKLYGYLKNRKDQGEIHESPPGWKEEWGKGWRSESYKCFGLPLTSITNAQDINDKIVEPLLKLFSG
jgi:hypothetical protein